MLVMLQFAFKDEPLKDPVFRTIILCNKRLIDPLDRKVAAEDTIPRC